MKERRVITAGADSAGERGSVDALRGEEKKRPCTVTVEQKRLRISAGAGEGLGERADLYVCGQVYALISNKEGDLVLHRDLKVGKCADRRNISCGTVAAMLRDRLGAGDGNMVLAAWRDPGGALLFGRQDPDHAVFPEGFHKIQVPVEEYLPCPAAWKGYTLLLSRRAGLAGPVRASVWEGVLCLEPDPQGTLTVDLEGQRPHIQSVDLAGHLRRLCPGSARLAGWRSHGKLYLAAVPRPTGWDRHQYVPLAALSTPEVTVRLGDNDSLYLSEAAVAGMGDFVTLWTYGQTLALHPSDGPDDYRLCRRETKRYVCIHRSTLARFLRFTQQGGRKFYAQRLGDSLYFSAWRLDALPPKTMGRKIGGLSGHTPAGAVTAWSQAVCEIRGRLTDGQTI